MPNWKPQSGWLGLGPDGGERGQLPGHVVPGGDDIPADAVAEHDVLRLADPVSVPLPRLDAGIVRGVRHRPFQPDNIVEVLLRSPTSPGQQRVADGMAGSFGAQRGQPGWQLTADVKHAEDLGNACRGAGCRGEGRARRAVPHLTGQPLASG